MTGPISISVIVASRGRPKWLGRCLNSLKQLDHPQFEIIVVADSRTLSQIDEPQIRTLLFEEANLAAARNIGVVHAGGELCAFIDDDAVAEPMWLQHLEVALRQTGAVAAVGFVRGRNGISFQSRLCSVDAEAETHVELCSKEGAHAPVLQPGRAVKLVGTNFAIRRDVLERQGGFDEAFRFYLEDSDLSYRLMKAGERVAVAPQAQVHHGFASSSRRTKLRAPLDLFDIGRSTSIYLRKHLGSDIQSYWERVQEREKARLDRHLVAGTCEPRDVSNRLRELGNGWDEGAALPLTSSELLPAIDLFAPFPASPPGHVVLSSRWLFQRRKLVRKASGVVSEGRRASVFSFSLTPFRHHVSYVESGFWLQTGGVYGRSDRDGRIFKWCRFADRLRREIGRVALCRGISENNLCKWWE